MRKTWMLLPFLAVVVQAADTTIQVQPGQAQPPTQVNVQPAAPAQTAPTQPTQNTPIQNIQVQPAAPVTPVVVTPPPPPPPERRDDDDDEKVALNELSIDPGIAIPSGSSDDYLDESFALNLSWLGRVHDIVQMGPEVGYVFGMDVEGNVPQGSGPALRVTGSEARILHLTPEIRIGPVVDAGGVTLHPYIMGGGGYYWSHYTDGRVGTTNIDSHDDHNGGWNVGGGLLFRLPKNVGLGFEARYHNILYKDTPDVKYIQPTLKVTFLVP